MTELATEKQIKFMKSLNIPVHDGISKEAAKEMISINLESKEQEQIPVVKPGEAKAWNDKPKSGFPTSMKVSYAKDIFCAMYEHEKPVEEEHLDNLMQVAIMRIKQAEEGFS